MASDTWRAFFAFRRFAAIAAALPIAVGLEALGTYKEIERVVAPILAHLTVLTKDEGVRLVTIDSEDLPGHTTLEPEDLKRIIEEIRAADPLVIGVDFDTSAEKFSVLAGESFPNVIWSRPSRRGMREGITYVGGVLGGNENVASALVEWPEEEDGMIRRYQRSIPTDLKTDLWFLPCAIMRFPNPSPTASDSDYRSIEYHFPLPAPMPFRYVKNNPSQLKGKRVLVGGEYRGLDEHDTPLGWMPGVEIMQQIAETDRSSVPRPRSMVVASLVYLCAVAMAGTFIALSKLAYALAMAAGEILAFSYLFQVRFHAVDLTWYLFVTLILVLLSELRSKYLESKKQEEKAQIIKDAKEECRGLTIRS